METCTELKCVSFLFTAFIRYIFIFDKYLATYERIGLEMQEETHLHFHFLLLSDIII